MNWFVICYTDIEVINTLLQEIDIMIFTMCFLGIRNSFSKLFVLITCVFPLCAELSFRGTIPILCHPVQQSKRQLLKECNPLGRIDLTV